MYGRRGLFLASLASLSLLTVTSRHLRHQSTNTVIFHHATPIARLIPAPIQQGLRFSGHGTRVTVNDLFGNMPVRVKSRALALQKPDELEREWEDLKQLLVGLALADDQLTKLVLSDGDRGRKITIRPQSQGQHMEGELDVSRTSSILSQAGLINFQNPDCWNAVSACVPDFSIHAAICLVPSPTKRVQFISLGMAPVFPRNRTNVLFNEVNKLFASSDFGTGVSGIQNADDGHTKVMQKAVNRWPMFYIRIDTTASQKWYEEGNEAPESDKSVQRILDVLAAMINEFLAQLSLRPRAGKRKRRAPALSEQEDRSVKKFSGPVQSRQSDSTEEALDGRLKLPSFQRTVPIVSQHFGDWSRVKGAKEPLPHTKTTKLDMSGVHNENVGPTHVNAESSDTVIPWTDPCTGRTHMVNSRTGQSVIPLERPRSTGFIQPKQALERVRRPQSAIPSTQNSWIDDLLKKWKNPTFSRAEKPISSIGIGSHGHELATTFEHDCSGDLCGLDTVRFSKFRGKIWKQDLGKAEVVAQVDQKFILVKLPTSDQTGTVLTLIDQHAADERCRVERLFGDLFKGAEVHTIAIEPITFEAPMTEKSLLKRHQRFFRSWGVDYRVEQAANRICISVHSMPTLIAERCRTEPNLVTELIRGEIWKREESGVTDIGTRNAIPGTTWVECLNGCPRGIIDLLNSRACRTAIMFNDILSVDECQQLVSQLAQCVFPFQCAHGRPSMVPLLDMEVHSSLGVNSELDEGRVGFEEAFLAYAK